MDHQFSSVQFMQPLTLHQRALILVATCRHHLLELNIERGIMKDRLQNNKLWNYTGT